MTFEAKAYINYPWMKARRMELRLTQHEVAVLAGLSSVSHYCKIERGEHKMVTVRILCQIAWALQCRMDDLTRPMAPENAVKPMDRTGPMPEEFVWKPK